MIRRNLSKWMFAAAIAVAGLVVDARSSLAHFHGGWGSSSSSSSGCWGCSSCSSSGCWGCSSSSSSSGGWGWHHAYYSSWGCSSCSSSGCWGGYYWGCSSSSSSDSWGCSSSSSSSSGTVIYDNSQPAPDMQSKPAAPAGGAPTQAPGSTAPAAPTSMNSDMYRSLDGSQTALLSVSVPAEAKIFVNGAETTSTGNERQFVSRGLTAGNRYEYEVRAEMLRDGNTVTETKTVTLGPGQQVNLTFNFEDNKEAPVAAGSKAKTKLTLHVPADAKVFLAGHETSATGEVREFTTSKLDSGAEWKSYTVRVVSNINGRDVSKDETITLTGGEDRDLTFDFNSNSVATTAAVTR